MVIKTKFVCGQTDRETKSDGQIQPSHTWAVSKLNKNTLNFLSISNLFNEIYIVLSNVVSCNFNIKD